MHFLGTHIPQFATSAAALILLSDGTVYSVRITAKDDDADDIDAGDVNLGTDMKNASESASSLFAAESSPV